MLTKEYCAVKRGVPRSDGSLTIPVAVGPGRLADGAGGERGARRAPVTERAIDRHGPLSVMEGDADGRSEGAGVGLPPSFPARIHLDVRSTSVVEAGEFVAFS
jgi:hypothetical protein